MGLKNYFKANKGNAQQTSTQQMASSQPMMEKGQAHPMSNLEASRTPMSNTPRMGSSRASLAPSTRSSTFMDDIKHEVMCNYLYQQQCSHLWVSDGSGELEGILLRKSRNNYIACPPQLAESPIARATAALNCQVCCLYASEN